jgi:hypothetical protein
VESPDGSYTLLSDLIRPSASPSPSSHAPPTVASATASSSSLVGGESKGPVVTLAAAVPLVGGDASGAAVGYSVFSAADFLAAPSSTSTTNISTPTPTPSSYDSYSVMSAITASTPSTSTVSSSVSSAPLVSSVTDGKASVSSMPIVNWQARFEEALMMPANDTLQKLEKARALRDVTLEFSAV